MSQFLLGSHGIGNRADSTPGGGWVEEKPGKVPSTLLHFFPLEAAGRPSFRLPGAQKGISGFCAPQHTVNPIHIHGHPGEEIGELEGGTFTNHEGVDSMKNAIADQGAT